MSTQSSSIFIKHVTVFYKSPTSEWRLRVENQSINVFPLPLVFFYLYHLFFKILNSTDPHSFLSLQQSSSYAGRDPEQNIELKKRSSIFLTFLPYPDPDSSTRIRIRIRIKKTTGPGSQKKTDADPQPGSAFFFFFLSPLLFSWDGDLNLEPDRVTNFNKEKRKKVRRPLINASFFFLRKSLKFHCFSYFNNFLCLFRLLKTQVFFSLYSTQISANLNLDPDSRIRVRQRSASNDKIDGSGTA